MATKRRTPPRRTSTRRRTGSSLPAIPLPSVGPEVARSILGIVFLVLGAVTLIALALPGQGALTDWWRDSIAPWFETGRWLLPFLLLALNLLPAVIVGGVMVFVGLDELPIAYAEYASTTQVLLGIFVASQAPVLFSRDLRHGTISLYLARPLRSSTYALARWASLLGATLVVGLIYVVLNLLADLLYRLLDPRTR